MGKFNNHIQVISLIYGSYNDTDISNIVPYFHSSIYGIGFTDLPLELGGKRKNLEKRV